jgi:antitoxin ParD1/3/4
VKIQPWYVIELAGGIAMASLRKRTISLPDKEADYLESLVASGTYPSESDVIRAGLHALQDREAELEEWLREDVLPVVKAMEADPSRAVSADEVTASLQARYAKWLDQDRK